MFRATISIGGSSFMRHRLIAIRHRPLISRSNASNLIKSRYILIVLKNDASQKDTPKIKSRPVGSVRKIGSKHFRSNDPIHHSGDLRGFAKIKLNYIPSIWPAWHSSVDQSVFLKIFCRRGCCGWRNTDRIRSSKNFEKRDMPPEIHPISLRL